MPTTTVMTLGQVLELPSGSWVNDPFEAHVLGLEKKEAKKTGRAFWLATLGGETGAGRCELALFTAPKFAQGDVIEISGQGVKYKEDNYGKKISVGEKADIRVVRRAAGGANGARSATPPEDRSAPAQEAHRPGDVSEFHRSMKKMALFYLHAMRYADEIDKRKPFVTPEQQQACVSTLFIEGCRRQLIDIVPPIDAAAEKPAAPPPPPPPPRQPPPDEEDVPF